MIRRALASLLRVALAFAVFVLGLWLAITRPIWTGSGEHLAGSAVDQQRLRQIVEQLSTDWAPRDYASVEHTEAVAIFIEQQLSLYSAEVESQRFRVDGQPYRNLIASFGPDSEQVYVVGAHYDAVSTTPGADDNASGVAGLLELARLLAGQPLKHRVLLASYALEEPPHFPGPDMGSHVHARSLAGREVKLMISLEMIGYFSDEPGSQLYPNPVLAWFYPSRGNFITVVEQFSGNSAYAVKAAINRHTDLPAYSVNAPDLIEEIGFSDHRNFWLHGYPAVMVTDTAFMRNLQYHDAGDTADRLDYVAMSEVVYGVYRYLLEVAAAPERSAPR